MSASSEGAMSTPSDEKISSCKSLGWTRFRKRIVSTFCRDDQQKNGGRCGVNYLSVMSTLQIILGFLAICLALVALAAAFNVREYETRISFWNLRRELNDYYQEKVRNLTKQSDLEAEQLNQWMANKIHDMKSNNCTWTAGYLPPKGPIPTQSTQHYEYGPTLMIPEYCDFRKGTYRKSGCLPAADLEKYHLIIDYLGIPGWTGIILIVTGLVGLRMVNKWKEFEYLQVSHSYTVLNVLSAVLFAPGMLTVGILQIVFSDYWDIPFRHVVGRVTVGFAGVIMIMSILICVVNCCCPVKPYKGLYKEFSGEPIGGDGTKEKPEKDAVVIA